MLLPLMPVLQSLSWVFGASPHVKHGIVNLSDGFSERICYVAAHTAVIYDKRQRKQVFLQVSRASGGSGAVCSARKT